MKDTDDYEEQIVGCNGIRDMVITEGGTACYNQVIYNDLSLERTEYAGLKLTVRDSTALTDISEDYGHATIKILDDEGWLCVYSRVAVLCVCVWGGETLIFVNVDRVCFTPTCFMYTYKD